MALRADDPIFQLTPEVIEKMSPRARRRALEVIRKRRRLLGLPDPPVPWGTSKPIELLRKVAAAQYVARNPGQVCPAKWNEGAKTIKPSLDLVGKI
mgnify:CR=1 FL=1